MPVNETVVDALTIGNVKTIAESGSAAIALATQNAVGHQARLNLLGESALAASIKRLVETDPSEAAALAVIGQQASKTAGNTPPVTP